MSLAVVGDVAPNVAQDFGLGRTVEGLPTELCDEFLLGIVAIDVLGRGKRINNGSTSDSTGLAIERISSKRELDDGRGR